MNSANSTLTLPASGAGPGDWRELVAILRERDQHIRELEAECRGLAEQLSAFQAEIVKWVELDR